MPFRDRHDAGRQLARLAEAYRGAGTIVLGLARGGVPVAFEVAEHLGAPFDIMVARKIGAPHQREFGIGAVAPGVRLVDPHSVASVGATSEEVEEIARDEEAEMGRRFHAYRGMTTPPDVRGKTVVLVDDGLATGVTARAAVASLRTQHPKRVILAVPVAAASSLRVVEPEFDGVIVVEAPEDLRAVGLWYDSFDQTRDEEVLDLLQRSRHPREPATVHIPVGVGVMLEGDLSVPPNAQGLVVFAHGSGSSRHSPRNKHVAKRLNDAQLGTLLLDLLTPEEEEEDARTRALRFDIPLLARRLVAALGWVGTAASTSGLPVGTFGSSTGAAAALIAAAQLPGQVRAVVSRGGRPDLAAAALAHVRAPTLLIVGGADTDVIELNERALVGLSCEASLVLVRGATHLFEEPGALDEVAGLAARWFSEKLAPIRENVGDAAPGAARRS